MSQVISFTEFSGSNRVRIGVISDTHIPDKGKHIPQAVLDDFKHVDIILHAGDAVNLAAIEELKSACPRVVAVAGNMDHEEVRKKYPPKQLLDVLGYRIGLTHGAGAPGNLLELIKDIFKEDGCDLIVFGHSHKPQNEKIDGILFFNPGTATDASAACNSYGVIELKKRPDNLAKNAQNNCGIGAKIIKL